MSDDNKELEDILKEFRSKKPDEPKEEISVENNTPPENSFSQTPEEKEYSTDELSFNDDLIQKSNKDDYIDDTPENYAEEDEETLDSNKKKKIIIAVIAVVLVIAIGVGVYFGFIRKPKDNTETTTKSTTQSATVAEVCNPLTGEAGFKGEGKRIVSFVVENSYYARPQWGIKTPDIIVEGEVEGGETRMLWLYGDYSKVPNEVGPMRSARPSYVKMAKYFDAVYIHWGGSHSKSGYVGGYETINNEGVDDLDGMSDAGFGRDNSKSGNGVEHTGVFYGNKIDTVLSKYKIRKTIDTNKTTSLNFYKKATKVGTTACNNFNIKLSSQCYDTKKFTYSTSDKLYHNTESFKTEVKFTNLVVLYDKTDYITTPYKSASETYVNYRYAGGKGKIVSQGTVADITWSVENDKLVLKDSTGKALNLNKGKTWIGLANADNNTTTIA